jgi:hypothetical protein
MIFFGYRFFVSPWGAPTSLRRHTFVWSSSSFSPLEKRDNAGDDDDDYEDATEVGDDHHDCDDLMSRMSVNDQHEEDSFSVLGHLGILFFEVLGRPREPLHQQQLNNYQRLE